MSLNNDNGEAARRQRIQRELEQRRAKCRTLDAVIISQRNELSILSEKREKAQQEWRNVANRRLGVKDPSLIAEFRMEQQRLRAIVDQFDREIYLASSRLQHLLNDHVINRCNAL